MTSEAEFTLQALVVGRLINKNWQSFQKNINRAAHYFMKSSFARFYLTIKKHYSQIKPALMILISSHISGSSQQKNERLFKKTKDNTYEKE